MAPAPAYPIRPARPHVSLDDRSRSLAVLVIALVGAVGPVVATPLDDADAATDLVQRYVEALRDGDVAGARACWDPDDRVRAERLGITYSGLPLKIDGDSPLMLLSGDQLHGVVAGQPERYARDAPSPFSQYRAPWAVPVLAAMGGDTLTFAYCVGLRDGEPRLRARAVVEEARILSLFATTRYVRLHTTGRPPYPPVVAALDRFVADTVDRLGVAEDRRAVLEREKIDYDLTSETSVEMVAGAPTIGVANLQIDAVFTSHPYHVHELAHLLVNFWLGDLPLYAHPLLQEGLAVHLGGRWGRSAPFLRQVGRYLLASGFVSLDDLSTVNGFRAVSAGVSYPPAGLFAGWILDTGGPAALERAYRSLCADPEELASWSAAEVRSRVAEAMGIAADEVAPSFQAYVDGLPANPMAPGVAGRYEDDGEAFTVRSDSLEVALWHHGGRWNAEVRPLRGVRPEGALWVWDVGDPEGRPRFSKLFAEHHPDLARETPPRYALRFSPAEVGWYEYGRDLLLAKHIAGFWPSDGYQDDATGALRFSWPDSLVPGVGPGTGWRIR